MLIGSLFIHSTCFLQFHSTVKRFFTLAPQTTLLVKLKQTSVKQLLVINKRRGKNIYNALIFFFFFSIYFPPFISLLFEKSAKTRRPNFWIFKSSTYFFTILKRISGFSLCTQLAHGELSKKSQLLLREKRTSHNLTGEKKLSVIHWY